jgi:hypothetical protein
MIDAMLLTLAGVEPGGVTPALVPLVVGLLSAFVAYGRWRLAPQRGSSEPRQRQPIS